MIIFENKNTCFIYVIWEHNIIISISHVFLILPTLKNFNKRLITFFLNSKIIQRKRTIQNTMNEQTIVSASKNIICSNKTPAIKKRDLKYMI